MSYNFTIDGGKTVKLHTAGKYCDRDITVKAEGINAEVIEDLPIDVDFSEGDQTVTAPDGYLVKSAILQKPETLVPENIAKDVDIAGVVGTMSAGGGGLDEWLNGELTDIYSEVESVSDYACYKRAGILTVNFPAATSVCKGAFNGCSALTTANIPNATSIGDSAFYGCSALTTANFPNATSIGDSAFYGCNTLRTVDFSAVTSVGEYGIYQCNNLKKLILPNVTSLAKGAINGNSLLQMIDLYKVESIAASAFGNCLDLKTLVIRSASMSSIAHGSAIVNTKIQSGTGYIYVPAALVDSYKAATYWSIYAAQFRALEDYTVDGTTTGALDETKI